MKILHFADPHWHHTTHDNVERAAAMILALARREKPDLIVNAGDIAMHRGSIAPWIADELRRFHVELAAIAPLIVVAGNHDHPSVWGQAGTLRGVLSRSEATDRITIAEVPGTEVLFPSGLNGQPLLVAFLPYPSKPALMAYEPDLPASEVNARASDLLESIVRGMGVNISALVAEQGASAPPLLIYHGSISGALTSTEQKMTTETDVVLREGAIPEVFGAVLCGHIHRYQQIGRAVYSGSPCPLDFGEANHPHGVVVWESDGGPWSHRFVELEPKHRLVTVDLRVPGGGLALVGLSPISVLAGARVRVRAFVPRGAGYDSMAAEIRHYLEGSGAHEVILDLQRAPENGDARPEIKAEATVDALLPLYAERNPDAAAILQSLVSLAHELEGSVPPEARASEAWADYRLIGFEARDFNSLADTGWIDFTRLGALVCVEGENASGKSNLSELEGFALWGQTPRGAVPLGDYVRHGTQECAVTLVFRSGRDTYRVRRSVKLNTKGIGASDLSLMRLAVDATDGFDILTARWDSASRGTARETQRFIEQLVGPFDLYLRTRCASQNDIEGMILETPSQRKDTLQAALGTGVFDVREGLAKERAAREERTLADHEAKHAAALERAQEADAARADLETAAETMVAAVAEVAVHSGELDRLREQDREAAEAFAAAKAGDEKKGALRRRKMELENRAQEIGEQSAALHARIADADHADAALKSHHADRLTLSTLKAQHEAREVLSRSRDEALGSLNMAKHQHAEDDARHRREAARLSEAHEAALRAQTTGQDARAAERQRMDAQIERERSIAAQIGAAPFKEKCAEARCALLSLPLQARDRLPEMEADFAALADQHKVSAESEGATCFRAREALVAAQNEHRDWLEAESVRLSELATAHQDTSAALASHAFDEAAYQRIQRSLMAFNEIEAQALAQAGAEARGALSALTAERERVEAEVAGLRAEIEAMPDSGAAAAIERQQEISTLTVGIARRLTEAREAHQRAVAAHAAAEARLRDREGDGAEAARLEALCASTRKAVEIARVLARAFGRDGLPMLMLERAIPALEAHANYYLGEDSDLRVEIEPLRDLQSGEQRSEVNIRFVDRFGVHPLVKASGYQRVAMGYALRASLARVMAEARGLRLSHWIADEGWGAFDEAHLTVGQQMLRRLVGPEGFDRVLFISHVGAIREVADSRIRVVADPVNGSRIEMDARPQAQEVVA